MLSEHFFHFWESECKRRSRLGEASHPTASKHRYFPWQLIFPGVTMALTLFSLNFLGDGLRDALDPQTRNFRLVRVQSDN